MKTVKRLLSFMFLTVVLFSFSACQKSGTNEVIDYSEYPFTDVSWERKTEYDIETIWFGSDGDFSYSCACGNPVNDSDLCDGYIYDEKTKTITLNYIETTEEAVPVIKIEMYDENCLKLNFDGEIREFYRVK